VLYKRGKKGRERKGLILTLTLSTKRGRGRLRWIVIFKREKKKGGRVLLFILF